LQQLCHVAPSLIASEVIRWPVMIFMLHRGMTLIGASEGITQLTCQRLFA
jgi:hypothetical protein